MRSVLLAVSCLGVLSIIWFIGVGHPRWSWDRLMLVAIVLFLLLFAVLSLLLSFFIRRSNT